MTQTAQKNIDSLEVIFDNGGGVTVQCDEWTHNYHDARQAAADVRAILAGDQLSDWEGNNPHDRSTCTEEDIRNGGARIFDADDIRARIDPAYGKSVDEEPWGYNVRDFFSVI